MLAICFKTSLNANGRKKDQDIYNIVKDEVTFCTPLFTSELDI